MPPSDPIDLAAEQARLRALLGCLVATGGILPDAAQRLDAEVTYRLHRVSVELQHAVEALQEGDRMLQTGMPPPA
jgi:hypothetical protein